MIFIGDRYMVVVIVVADEEDEWCENMNPAA